MILENFGINYVPKELPCGEEVNQDYDGSGEIECCHTICPKKTPAQITKCYKMYKESD